ncbi:hypothetical protein F5Y16DRAFT_349827 [Xylariaceae sp. FL0255]|nr:hypothetical protein F5Y16DRAFT_349827 [Xylariaceae sp. FL0255]
MNSSDPDAPSRIAGFASLDYRLSAHEKLPQDSASTAPKEYRDARHPDHIDDVRAGVSFLQVKYGFADNYIIIGHSAGACLAFQLVAAPVKADVSVVPPAAVIGIAGIYDFIGLDERFKGTYTAFFESAFGDTKNWDTAAPVKASLGSWDGKVILAWSKEDSLVDEPEIDIMERKLRDDGFSPDVFKDLQGHHNDCWEKGTDIARLIKFGLSKI